MSVTVIKPVLEALSQAIGVPVSLLASVPPGVRRQALMAVGDNHRHVGRFEMNGSRYLAYRYDSLRDAVAVLGPYRCPDDPMSEVATLDQSAESRAIAGLHAAGPGFHEAGRLERQRLELANQLEVVSRSVLAVTSELELDVVLNRIVDLARELAGSRYAALGVPGPGGDLVAFLTSGMTLEEEARIPHRPRGKGILGLLLAHPKTIRIADLNEHPAAAGFPAHHPPMKSFLGVPIISRDRVLGNLYLTEKRGATEFTEEDARLVELLARHAAVAIENARLYQTLETQQRRLQEIVDQLPEAVMVIEPNPDRVTLANPQTERLLGWDIQTPLPLGDFLSRNPRFDIDGNRLSPEAVPMMRSLHNGEELRRMELRLQRTDGQIITILVNSTPLRDRSGHVTAAVVVFQDITQIKDAEQLKDDFLSLVSHELRTPLTTVQGAATMMTRDWERLDTSLQQDLLNDIASESRRLGVLIENMVQLANIRAGRHILETEPILVRALIDRAIEAERHFAPDRKVSVNIEPALLALGDSERLEQVLRNLLRNAVKYSPAGSPVEITARRTDGVVEIGVRDYGAGIDEEELPLVFDRFHRTERARAGGSPGMGLGLYLSRHVIEAHGGRIWIERPEGGGTRFLFTVPAITDEDERAD